MANTYKDFDEFFGEMEKKSGLKIKLFGKEYELPTEIPAVTMLETYRAYKKGDATLSDAQQMAISFQMLGEDNVNEWCNNGLTMTQLTEIMKWVAVQHQEEASPKGGKSGKK